MSDDSIAVNATVPISIQPARTKVIPMEVGEATVFVAVSDSPVDVQATDQIYAVFMPSPKEAFESALKVITECVGGIGKGLESLAAELKPDQLSVEFSLQFEGAGTAQVIPLLVTTQTKATGGIKVNAVWRLSDKDSSAKK